MLFFVNVVLFCYNKFGSENMGLLNFLKRKKKELLDDKKDTAYKIKTLTNKSI